MTTKRASSRSGDPQERSPPGITPRDSTPNRRSLSMASIDKLESNNFHVEYGKPGKRFSPTNHTEVAVSLVASIIA
ncbi:hypothetical protein [Micromonospora sp. WMMD1219]|uniref:hypothetical protein n=1 Tax=Micromonospora sp. WMMD1219 TaxID=3404115 RepID=UPI003BF48AD8